MKTMTEIKTNKLTLVQAVTDGLRTMLREHEEVLVLGEDVGQNGGVFRATDGLAAEFGEARVMDTPLAEAGIVGTSIGLAINGFRPVAEMQFLGFVYPAYEQIMTHASRIRSRTLSRYSVPMVIRAPYGGGIRAPEIHSDSCESLFTHMPGMKVVVPSNPYDAKGLLIAAIEDPDPVLFMEPMRSYRAFKADVPEEKYTVELGKGAKLTEGEDVTVIAWGNMVSTAQKAVDQLKDDNISCELLDLRTLYPLDKDLIAESVKKTGRAVIVHEAPETGGVGNDVLSVINNEAFLYLRSPVQKVAGFDTPFPFFSLEEEYLPTPERITHAIKKAVTF
ncbi:alpha-ketoacid dehydrogenase subunit beta [Alteribacter lacisalsi]|uniref:Alpha-ketoacid dehydrogenase subunit beta n=1 Tax=Alteribacter lacisalsi TaxID=2045244 RepID=A0A2W0H7N2_9BACI|nr:alpha-ketoacid dehydrogenase subunit beta [Alteribacter lacisalsi]PYZ97873.1 alpha-ketoacid dehydrogenase subunit beta [Alteribacter lacisalsi]